MDIFRDVNCMGIGACPVAMAGKSRSDTGYRTEASRNATMTGNGQQAMSSSWASAASAERFSSHGVAPSLNLRDGSNVGSPHYLIDNVVAKQGLTSPQASYRELQRGRSSGRSLSTAGGWASISAYRLGSLLTRLPLADAARGCPFPIAMLVCRYLPPDSRVICRDHGVAYLDLMGNASLAFDSVYIERAVPDKPKSETRSLRSVFSPKAAAILRALHCDPHKPWRVADLADAANASLGHISNVRKVLLDREWAEKQADGIVIANPGALLKTWRESYRNRRGVDSCIRLSPLSAFAR